MDNTLQRFLINVLSKYYGYKIIEFKIGQGLTNEWGLIKKLEDKEEIICFATVSNLEVTAKGIERFIDDSYIQSDKLFITVIMFSKGKDLFNEVSSMKSYFATTKDYYISFILMDESEQKIYYHDANSEDTANILEDIFKNNTNARTKNIPIQKPYITYILIGLNLLMYIISAFLAGNIFDINSKVLVSLGAKVNSLISTGEYYRLVMAMFLHGGLVHIGFNMYALYALGPFIEKLYGKIKFVIVYFVAGIMGSLFSYIFSNSISVGASGAIFGLLGAALVYGIIKRNNINKGFLSNILQVIGINLILGFTVSNIDNYGHIGGLIGGFAIALILKEDKK